MGEGLFESTIMPDNIPSQHVGHGAPAMRGGASPANMQVDNITGFGQGAPDIGGGVSSTPNGTDTLSSQAIGLETPAMGGCVVAIAKMQDDILSPGIGQKAPPMGENDASVAKFLVNIPLQAIVEGISPNGNTLDIIPCQEFEHQAPVIEGGIRSTLPAPPRDKVFDQNAGYGEQ